MTKKQVMPIEQAEAELIELFEEMEIDTDVESMLPDNAEGFSNTLRNLAMPITKGRAIISDGEYVLTLRKPFGEGENKETTITISEPSGAAWDAMKTAGRKDNGMKGTMLFCATMVGIPYIQLTKLPASDFKIVKEFALLFMV